MKKVYNQEEVLAAACAEGDKWLAAFQPLVPANPEKILEAFKIAWPNDYILIAKSPEESVEKVKEGVAYATGLGGKELEAKIEELQPWNCIWDYYLMAFFESAAGVLGEDEPEFTKDHSMFDSFSHGLGFFINLDSVKIGICRPVSHTDDQQRIHCEDGPAIKWLTGKTQYWWHGVQVPEEWIEQKNTIDPKIGWAITNMEQKRCFFEIVGWARVLDAVDTTLIQEDETGKLLEASIPIDNEIPRTCRFVLVTCPSTGRKYALLVPPETTTAKQGVAGSWGLTPEEFKPVLHT